MLHMLRLNVHGIGFRTFVAEGAELAAIPLGSVPPGLAPADSRGYEAVQQHLDEFLDAPNRPWAMAFARTAPSARVAVGYGGRVDARDDHGRAGLRFTHVCLLDDAADLPRGVLSVLALLSLSRFRELTGELAAVAQGQKHPEEVVRWLTGQVGVGGAHASAHIPPRLRDRFRAIVHDTAGAAPVAWLTLAVQQQDEFAPWEVYDATDRDGRVSTVCSGDAGSVVPASTLLVELAGRGLAVGQAPTAAEAKVPSPVEIRREASRAGSDWLVERALVPTLIAAAAAALAPVAVLTGIALTQRGVPGVPVLAVSGALFLLASFAVGLFAPRRRPAEEGSRERAGRLRPLAGQVALALIGLLCAMALGALLYARGVPGRVSGGGDPATETGRDFGLTALARHNTDLANRLEGSLAELRRVQRELTEKDEALGEAQARLVLVRDTVRMLTQGRDSAVREAERFRRELGRVRGSEGAAAASAGDGAPARPDPGGTPRERR